MIIAVRRALPFAAAAVVLLTAGCSGTVTGAPQTAGASSSATPTSGGATSGTSPAPTTSGGSRPGTAEVDAAREGLASWLAAHKPDKPTTTTNIPGCPAIQLPDLQEAVAKRGATESLQDWTSEIEWNGNDELNPDLMGVACGGDSDGDTHDSDFGTAAGISAIDLTGKATFDDYAARAGISAARQVDTPSMPLGESVAMCVQGQYCLAMWHDADGLAIGVSLIGVPGADTDDVAALLDDVGPTILRTLAELK